MESQGWAHPGQSTTLGRGAGQWRRQRSLGRPRQGKGHASEIYGEAHFCAHSRRKSYAEETSVIGRRLSRATSGGRTRRSYIEKSGVLVGTKNVAYKRHYRSSDVGAHTWKVPNKKAASVNDIPADGTLSIRTARERIYGSGWGITVLFPHETVDFLANSMVTVELSTDTKEPVEGGHVRHRRPAQ